MSLFRLTLREYGCGCDDCTTSTSEEFEYVEALDADATLEQLQQATHHGTDIIDMRPATELEEDAYFLGSYEAEQKSYRNAFNQGMNSERQRIDALMVGKLIIDAPRENTND